MVKLQRKLLRKLLVAANLETKGMVYNCVVYSWGQCDAVKAVFLVELPICLFTPALTCIHRILL